MSSVKDMPQEEIKTRFIKGSHHQCQYDFLGSLRKLKLLSCTGLILGDEERRLFIWRRSRSQEDLKKES